MFVFFVSIVDVGNAFHFHPAPVLRFSRPFRTWIPILSSKPLRRFAFVVVRTVPNIGK
jgi:hypothetical protein